MLASCLGGNLIGTPAQGGKEEGSDESGLCLKGGTGWIFLKILSKASSCLTSMWVMFALCPAYCYCLDLFKGRSYLLGTASFIFAMHPK